MHREKKESIFIDLLPSTEVRLYIYLWIEIVGIFRSTSVSFSPGHSILSSFLFALVLSLSLARFCTYSFFSNARSTGRERFSLH